LFIISDYNQVTAEDNENNEVEQVIQSEIFREELQEMVAEHLANNLMSSQQPLTDILTLRQRFGNSNGVHGL
jgi:hypothetical protein